MNTTGMKKAKCGAVPPGRGGIGISGMYRMVVACMLCMVALQPALRADEPNENLDHLRKEYQVARDTVAGQKEWDWEASKELNRSGQAFLSELLSHWAVLPVDSPDTTAVSKEIRSVIIALARCGGKEKVCGSCRATENWINQQSYLAGIAWPLLAEAPLRTEQAAFLAELTNPSFGVRIEDWIARLGSPTELYGLDVQATHALALIRSGERKKARTEVKRLNRKVSMNELKDRLSRNYTNELQLCEVLYALQAASSGDHEAAEKHLEQARKLGEGFSAEASPLVDEIEQRAKAKPNEKMMD